MPTASAVSNYFIGKGVAYFKKDGDSVFRDLGNASKVEFTPNLTKLDHFSSRAGVKTKDRTVVVEKKATLNIVLDEFMIENLELALLGEISTNTAGHQVVEIFSENAISGVFKLVGSNEVGAQFTLVLNKVDFIPSKALGFITDEWGQIELEGECATVSGSFGTLEKTADEA